MSLDDQNAFKDWGWQYNVSMYDLAKKILTNIDESYKEGKHLNISDIEDESSTGEEHSMKRTLDTPIEKISSIHHQIY